MGIFLRYPHKKLVNTISYQKSRNILSYELLVRPISNLMWWFSMYFTWFEFELLGKINIRKKCLTQPEKSICIEHVEMHLHLSSCLLPADSLISRICAMSSEPPSSLSNSCRPDNLTWVWPPYHSQFWFTFLGGEGGGVFYGRPKIMNLGWILFKFHVVRGTLSIYHDPINFLGKIHLNQNCWRQQSSIDMEGGGGSYF